MTDAAFESLMKTSLQRAAWTELAPCMEASESREVPFSNEYIRRRKKLLQEPFSYAKRACRTVWQRMVHSAAVVAVIVTILFALGMSVPSVRAAVVNIVTTWYENRVELSFGNGCQEIEEHPLVSLEEFYGITPAVIPDGYSENDRNERENLMFVQFKNAEGNYLELKLFSTAADIVWGFDTEHCEISSYTEDGVDYQLFQTIDEGWPSRMVWEDKDAQIMFCLSSDMIPTDDLLIIAKSVVI